MTILLDTDTAHQIRTLAISAGMEAATDLANEGASREALLRCASPQGDWGISSSEAWYHQCRSEGLRHLSESEEAHDLYCEHYEAAARAQCRDLASEEE